MAFQLVSDSSCNLPADFIAAHHIPILPTIFSGPDGIERRSYLRGEVDLADFYYRMEAGEVFTTSLINRKICGEVIDPLLR
ncbi:MAG: DegV family protein, partial [Actinomycetes bacterium]|nr:DegV family protein [Actinomycetes bacterium]